MSAVITSVIMLNAIIVSGVYAECRCADSNAFNFYDDCL
jgi:hypothetical protein